MPFETDTPYRLNLDYLHESKVKIKTQGVEVREVSILDAFGELVKGGFDFEEDSSELDIELIGAFSVKTDKGIHKIFSKPRQNAEILKFILQQHKKDKKPLWDVYDWYFLYESWVQNNPAERKVVFFITLGEEIIAEEFRLLNNYNEECPKNLFREEAEFFTNYDKIFRVARTRLAHENFYKNTKHGRLLAVSNALEQDKIQSLPFTQNEILLQIRNELKSEKTIMMVLTVVIIIIGLIITT